MHRRQRFLRRRVVSVLMVCAGMVSLVCTMLPSAAVATSWDDPTRLPSPVDEAYPMRPRTDGKTVVWASAFGGATTSVVYGADIASGGLYPLSDEGRYAWHPDIVAGVAVWEEGDDCAGCGGDIHGTVLATGERFTVADSAATEYQPAIAHEWVVWVSTSDAETAIHARRLRGADAPIVLATADVGTLIRGLAIDGTRIAWTSADWEAQGLVRRLYAMEIGDAAPTEVHTFIEWSNYADHGAETAVQLQNIEIDISGDLLLTIDAPHSTLFEWNFVTEILRTENLGGQSNYLTADGRYLFWSDELPADDGVYPRSDLRGLDRETQHMFLAAGGYGRGWHAQPHLHGDVLTWSSCSSMHCDVVVSRVSERLPTMPRVLATVPADTRAFPETGHTLIGGFRNFWEQQGGVAIFGYPMSEEFIGYSIDRAHRFTMQFTERQRFEWHPDLVGTSYEVQLGRLGAEVLLAQGRHWTAFPKADPASLHYVAATGHAIDERFSSYWFAHGLDLGDAGVSYQESLALFGYPISPAMEETNADGDMVLTQYFERAVFEWHPENAGTGFEVLLRRVSVDLLQTYGWLPAQGPGANN